MFNLLVGVVGTAGTIIGTIIANKKLEKSHEEDMKVFEAIKSGRKFSYKKQTKEYLFGMVTIERNILVYED